MDSESQVPQELENKPYYPPFINYILALIPVVIISYFVAAYLTNGTSNLFFVQDWGSMLVATIAALIAFTIIIFAKPNSKINFSFFILGILSSTFIVFDNTYLLIYLSLAVLVASVIKTLMTKNYMILWSVLFMIFGYCANYLIFFGSCLLNFQM